MQNTKSRSKRAENERRTDRLEVEKNENAEYEKPFKTCRERKTTKRAVLEIVAVLLS